MAPDKVRQAARDGGPVHSGRGTARARPRKAPKQRVHDLEDASGRAAGPHDDFEPSIRSGEPPREDRAG